MGSPPKMERESRSLEFNRSEAEIAEKPHKVPKVCYPRPQSPTRKEKAPRLTILKTLERQSSPRREVSRATARSLAEPLQGKGDLLSARERTTRLDLRASSRHAP